MKKIVPLIMFLAILFTFALPQESAKGAVEHRDIQADIPQAPLAITSTPTAVPTVSPTADPAATPTAVIPGGTSPTAIPIEATNGLACLRFNFEVTGDVAVAGTYEVIEVVSGRSLATWEAKDGWQDSGWINDIEITYDAVHVKVLYHPIDGSDPIEMAMANSAPGTEYGWVARGMCHALEIGWP